MPAAGQVTSPSFEADDKVMRVAACGAFVTIRGLLSQVPAVAYRS